MKNTLTLVLLLLAFNLYAQQTPELSQYPRRIRLIDKIEIFAGPGLYFPDDHGWAEHVYTTSDSLTTDVYNSGAGYLAGISLIQSIGNRFEIQAKISTEKRRYSNSGANYDRRTGELTSTSEITQKNDYISFSLVPVFFVTNAKKLHLFSGVSYYSLRRSIQYGTSYSSSGVPTGSASINTIGGFKPYLFDAILGGGYLFQITNKLECAIRAQGNYALNYSAHQNSYKISVNSASVSLAVRYTR